MPEFSVVPRPILKQTVSVQPKSRPVFLAGDSLVHDDQRPRSRLVQDMCSPKSVSLQHAYLQSVLQVTHQLTRASPS
jgi:hypothetical protein